MYEQVRVQITLIDGRHARMRNRKKENMASKNTFAQFFSRDKVSKSVFIVYLKSTKLCMLIIDLRISRKLGYYLFV